MVHIFSYLMIGLVGLLSMIFDPAGDAAAWERVMTPEAHPALVEALEALRSADQFDASSIEAALTPVVNPRTAARTS